MRFFQIKLDKTLLTWLHCSRTGILFKKEHSSLTVLYKHLGHSSYMYQDIIVYAVSNYRCSGISFKITVIRQYEYLSVHQLYTVYTPYC